MRMKRLILVLAAIFMVLLCVGAGAEVRYEVIEPAGFAGSALKYPVVYVMPENGYSNSKTNPMAMKLQEAMRSGDGIGMLLVMPSFDSDDNLQEEMAWLVNEIDNVVYAGKTIAEPGFRAAAGVDVGGYMAYATMLNASGAVADTPELFGFVASVRGRFAADGNPWYAKYGSMYDKMSKAGKSVMGKYFTYMDTPVDDPMADVDGSTNDMGYMFMKFLTGADKHEYTARPGTYNDAFMTESGKRIADRFTNFMMGVTMSQNSKVSSVLVTSADKTAEVDYSVSPNGYFPMYGATGVFHKFDPMYAGTKATVTIAVVDPDDPEKVLTSKKVSGNVTTWGSIAGTAELENVTNGRTCPIRVTVDILGATFEAATSNMVCIEDSVFEGEKQKVDLMGDWYFNYTGTGAGSQLNAASITKVEYETWSKVTPALAWWTNEFGNVGSAYAQGNAYYAREFELPAQFTTQNPMISVGYVDDRCEVFINGKRVGGTGFKADGSLDPEAKDTWSEYNCFKVDPGVLNYGGKNTIVIRVWNNTGAASGGGGWYAGPIQIGSESAFEGGSYTDRFYEETYYSANIGEDMEYLIYLPKNYGKTDRYYPTMYLLHQFSSNHTSFMVDGVNTLLDEAIADGLLDEMIVVIPNSDPNSWWMDKWEDMVIEDLIPYIDENYRTIKDARYRFTAGCSMGGQGAASMALTNPDLFSGFASFYGAYYGHFGGYFFSFGDSMGKVSPITVAKKDGAEYMKNFSTAFICGNQDSYQFGTGKIELHQLLKDYGIDHYFLIDNGGHDGDFYLPRFKDTLSFVWNHMYDETQLKDQEPDLSKMVTATLEKDENGLSLVVAPGEQLMKYFNELPASKSGYVKEQNPALSVPLRITISQGSQKFRVLLRDFTIEPGADMIVINNLTADDFAVLSGGNAAFNPEKKFTYTIEGAIFDNNWVLLGHVDNLVMPNTGDSSSLLLWTMALAASAALLLVISKKRAAA